MQAETWYRAQEAVDAGLADEVRTPGAAAKNPTARVFNLSKFQNVPEWVEKPAVPAAPPKQSAKEEEEMADENKIRQALGLDEEGDILAAVTGLHTEIATLKATLKDQDPPGKDENRTLKIGRAHG